MARHASGEKNYALAKELIIGIVAVLVLIAVLVAWMLTRNSAQNTEAAQNKECIAGELLVPVAVSESTSPDVARELMEAYSASHPQVKDHCVSLTTVQNINDAAAYIATGTHGAVQHDLKAHNVAAASDKWTVGASSRVGLAYTDNTSEPSGTWADQPRDGVYFTPPTTNPASALVAAAMTNNDAEAGSELLKNQALPSIDTASQERKTVAVTEERTPDGMYFFAPDNSSVPTFIVPLATREGVTEEQARSGADFAKFTAKNKENEADGSQVWADAADIMYERYADVPENSRGSTQQPINHTLLLVDTSDAMNASPSGHSLYAETAMLADPLVTSAVRAGGTVALWNYSSPLNPGVTKGWRDNVDFTTDVQLINDTLKRFGTGGVAQTREAVVAALRRASDYAASVDAPVQVVLVTSGTNDPMSDEDFRSALDQFRTDQLQLDVVTVGGGAEDGVLVSFAQDTGGHVSSGTSTDEIAQGMQAAFGIDRP